MTFIALEPMLGFLLHFWLFSALLTLVVHVVVSFAIDRRFVPGLWEQWALGVFLALGPAGVCLEILLVLSVLRDILGRPGYGRRLGNGSGPILLTRKQSFDDP